MEFMKNILFLKFLFFSFTVFSQSTDLKVEYKVFCNTEVPLTFETTLWANNEISIYKERLSTTKRWEELPTNVENVNVKKPSNVLEPYIKVDRINREVYFFASIFSNTFLVKDNYIELKWDVVKETKLIAGYTCTKAITKFRGREWVAWFASDLPLPFGPWKLHGLPGIILEAHDDSERYTFKVIGIQQTAADILKTDFKNLIKTKNEKAITFQQYLADQEEAINNLHKQFEQNVSGSVKTEKAPRNTEELVYEWE